MDDKKEIESANNQPAKAIDVARYLIGLAQQDGKPVDNLRLQKLLYYAWGYYWNSFKQYLFKDDIEAWKYGPVIKDVYDEYKIFDGGDILDSNDAFNESESKINDNNKTFLKDFYTFIKDYDTWVLVESSHQEKPWKETYNNGEQQIDFYLLEDFFNIIEQ